MPHRWGRNRSYWALFLGTWAILAMVIRSHVVGLDLEVRREGLSNAAIVACRSVLVDHLDVETGLRGYVVTANREYLRPYHEGLGRLDRDMAALHSAVAYLPNERAYHEALVEASRGVLAEFANQATMVEAGDREGARERFVRYPTKPGMDRIRLFLTSIQAEEDRRLADQMARLERSMATTIFLINTFIIVLLFVLLAMGTGFIAPPSPPHVASPSGPSSLPLAAPRRED